MVNLPFLQNLPTNKEKREFFLTLILKPFTIGAILFEEDNGKLLILATHEEQIEKEIDTLPVQELIAHADQVISTVEEKLPEGEEVKNTIFSLPYNYIAEGKIKREYLAKFKILCDELALIPMGFIVTVEAIVYFLQKKEGIPITSIIVEITKDTVYVYLVRSGSIVEVKFSPHVGDLATTIEKILKHVQSFEILPAKIILLTYEGIDEIQQILISYPWTKSLPFLHHPQVVTLEKGFEDEAIINGVASQMGFEITPEAAKAGAAVSSSEVDLTEDFGFKKEDDSGSVTAHEENGEELETEEINVEENTDQVEDITIQDMFERDEKNISSTDENRSTVLPLSSQKAEQNLAHYQENAREEQNEEGQEQRLRKRSTASPSIFSKVTQVTSVFGGLRLPRSPHGNFSFSPKLFGIIFLIVVIIIGFVWVYYNMLLRAEVIIFLSKKIVDKNESINFTKSADFSENKLSFSTFEIEKDETVSKETTGKKETGEKSKGEVIAYNKTEQKKTFPKGTILVGANSLEFELTSEVTIASTSAFSTNFSNVKVGVQATKFGSEYNLPSNTNFSFKDNPTTSFIAKNESAFSGGSKKEIAVVSKKDLQTLEASVSKNLSEKALDDIKARSQGNSITLPFILSSEFVEKKSNKKEGEEAKQISFTGKMKFTGGSYEKTEIENFIKDLAKQEIPSDYAMLDSESKYQLKDEEVNKDGTVSALLMTHAVYAPSVDESKIKSQVTGKSQLDAQKVLTQIPNVTDHKILYSNRLLFLPTLLPFASKNITVTIRLN